MVALLVSDGALKPLAVAATFVTRLATLWFAVLVGALVLLGDRRLTGEGDRRRLTRPEWIPNNRRLGRPRHATPHFLPARGLSVGDGRRGRHEGLPVRRGAGDVLQLAVPQVPSLDRQLASSAPTA
jgi:hypothetical protein